MQITDCAGVEQGGLSVVRRVWVVMRLLRLGVVVRRVGRGAMVFQ